MNSKYELNEKFNILNFKITGLTLQYSVPHDESVKSLVLILNMSSKQIRKMPKKSRKFVIYLVVPKHFLLKKFTSLCLKRPRYNVNISTFTLCYLMKDDKFTVYLYIPQNIPFEISLNQMKDYICKRKSSNSLVENIDFQSNILNANDETIPKNNEIIESISIRIIEQNGNNPEQLFCLQRFKNWIVENVKNIWNKIKVLYSMLFPSEPTGFSNNMGYCYLNSVLQLLVSCEDFSKYIESNCWKFDERTPDTIFVEGLFGLIKATRQNNNENIRKFLNSVQQYCTESSYGDDVYKCFMNTLSRINKVIQNNMPIPENCSSLSKKNQIPKFLLDNFYGKIQFQTICKTCQHTCCETVQWFKSLPLSVPNSKSSVTLETCVDSFFNPQEVKIDEPMKCQCTNGSMQVKSVSKLKYGPKYLFVYLNRGSFKNEEKNNTFVKCDKLAFNLETIEECVIKYKLIAVLDHVSFFNFGHYYCKCNYEHDQWW